MFHMDLRSTLFSGSTWYIYILYLDLWRSKLKLLQCVIPIHVFCKSEIRVTHNVYFTVNPYLIEMEMLHHCRFVADNFKYQISNCWPSSSVSSCVGKRKFQFFLTRGAVSVNQFLTFVCQGGLGRWTFFYFWRTSCMNSHYIKGKYMSKIFKYFYKE